MEDGDATIIANDRTFSRTPHSRYGVVFGVGDRCRAGEITHSQACRCL
jgi:hypothetical protein